MTEKVELRSKYFKNVNDNVPYKAIKKLADKAIKSKDSEKIKQSLIDIKNYVETLGHGNAFIPIVKISLPESSCIEYINKNGLAHYANNLISFITYSLLNQNKSAIYTLEEHFKHIHSMWMVKAFKYAVDVHGSELLMVYLTNSIGLLRAFYSMETSPVILKCKDQKENKCVVWNCPNSGDINVYTPFGIWKFCSKCNDKIMSNLQNVNMCTDMLKRSDGEMILIETWEEFVDRLMPEFLQMISDCLEIAGDKCCICGEKAVSTGTGFKPYCKDHMGFPLKVLKCVLRK